MALFFERFAHLGCAAFLSTCPSCMSALRAVGLPAELDELPWWTIRSITTAAIRSSPNTAPHRQNSRFVVMTTDCRSWASVNTWKSRRAPSGSSGRKPSSPTVKGGSVML